MADSVRETKIINLHGGPCSGKSTTAAEVFVTMKKLGMSVELAHEYAKLRAYRKHGIGKWDELYVFAKQLRIESAMYGQVEWIVTDRPLSMSVIYARFCGDKLGIEAAVENCLKEHKLSGVHHIDFLLTRQGPYSEVGRFHTLEQALLIDRLCKEYLPENTPQVLSAEEILHHLNIP